ncbi:recombinase family protein [Terasakiella sp. SH-1]|uniref:recombinase family protein n=1 Tax=Terasakiella sp. SH-1 TaxID=2560057 RepID=UPI001073628B|nr:recombinase family protein [Terasakiella sp. SH-1]
MVKINHQHVVSIALKVPLYTDDELGITVEEHYRHRSNHSTVEHDATSASLMTHFSDDATVSKNGDLHDNLNGNINGNSSIKVCIKFDLIIRSTAFWVSNYSEYQQFLSNKIAEFRDDGRTFKWIARWFNDNNHLTPRGKTFSDRHVHGILKKRQIRDARFLRPPVISISNVDLFYQPYERG